MHTAVNTHTVKSPDFFDKKRGVARLTSFAIIANSIESIPTRTNKRTVLCPVTAVFSCQVIMRLMLWVAAVWGRRVSRYLTPVLKTLYDNTKKVFWLKTKKCHTAAAIVWWANSVSSLSSRSSAQRRFPLTARRLKCGSGDCSAVHCVPLVEGDDLL